MILDEVMINKYLKEIFDTEQRGDAREESYYPSLKSLIEELGKKKKIVVTANPKKTEGGNPDFRVWDGKQKISGYIEAKIPGSNLSKIEDTEQLKRYFKAFPNVILTNFYEFWLYRDGELIEKVEIAFHSITKKVKTKPPVKDEEEFRVLIETFLSYNQPIIYNAQELAITLANKTRHLEKIVLELLEGDVEKKSDIYGFYHAFKEYLISDLDIKQCSDLYAQTITYGLFAARSRTDEGFTRKLAFDNIPRTIGILRDLFQNISLGNPPKQIEWIVDDISSVLAVADINKIMDTFYIEGKGKDPIIHFYETFLAAYDPQLRNKRGVYYTPEPVVSYIVRSVNEILKNDFGKSEGLADRSVTLLDPAAGTLTFVAHAFQVAMEEFNNNHGAGEKNGFIKEHLLKNFYAFELMMAPYAIGHLKMGFVLDEFNYKLKQDERFNLYLTNTLEMEDLHTISIPGIGKSLSEESQEAGKIKKEQPVMVIIGNPPYSGHSSNKSEDKFSVKKGERYISHYEINNEKGKYGLKPVMKKASKNSDKKLKTWIGEQIENYKIIDGGWLGEKNPKWLQDDYVKFIRFAQWKIDQIGEGVVGMITNHGYLDNPTFRGMRQSLMISFDQIYILDLHGNYNKKEKAPDGSKDENVFDIKQGVSIVFFVKKKGLRKVIKKSDLFGKRETKNSFLLEHDIKNTKWKTLLPSSDSYLFNLVDEKLKIIYDKFYSLPNLFPVNSVGIVTARDKLTIDFESKVLWNRVNLFINHKPEDARIAFDLGKDARDWKVHLAQEDILKDEPQKKLISKMLYRPFDIRYTYYTGKTKGFLCMPRRGIMQHMLKDNIGLITPKRVETKIPWSHILCTNSMIDHVTVSSKTIDYIFPLYIYPDEEKNDFFSDAEKAKGKLPNINKEFYKKLKETYKKKPTPEQILHYTYAVLYSNEYRTMYAEFLKIDFPKIPFTADYKLFKNMSNIGKQLTELHLLKSKKIDKSISRFQKEGSNRLGKTKKECRNYSVEENRVYINEEMQYFDNIKPEVWDYQIGGYQVLDKWLDSHKERILSLDDMQHFCKVVTALSFTIELQTEIDRYYSQVEPSIVEL